MEVGEAILAAGAGERPAGFAQFSAAIDPQWIADALAATGTASVRRRKLPADHVVWLVIGIGLFHDRSIAEVVHHLDLVLSPGGGGRGRVSNAEIVQARDQLGAAPLAALFTQTATAWTTDVARSERGHGVAGCGLGGPTLRVPPTPQNVTAFGRPPARMGPARLSAGSCAPATGTPPCAGRSSSTSGPVIPWWSCGPRASPARSIPISHAAGACRPRPASRLPPLLALHLAPQPRHRAPRGPPRALPRPLGT